MKPRNASVKGLLASVCLLAPAPAHAMPGFFAGKGALPTNDSTHVVVMTRSGTNVVTVMPDYAGDLKPFAFVVPVPDDVVIEDVKTLRRDFVDHVDHISAPRFHEFWEMDPCEPGPPQQIWEQDLTARSDTAFLGGAAFGDGEKPKRKVEKEMLLTVEPQFKEGEHTLHLLKADVGAEGVVRFLTERGYKPPAEAARALAPYVAANMSFVVAEVDDKKIELVSGSRAILSPIRFATKKPVKVASTLGLLNNDGKQELFVHVLDPAARYVPKNYETVFPPTNIEVDFKVKERMGEFYAGLHDLMLKKKPSAFLIEYAWHTSGCGQPCPNEPLAIHELLSLGADVFERDLPEEERKPAPPEMTEDEKKAFDEIKDKKEKKEIEEERKEVARRKALLERHKYVLTRMHHRYDRATLPHDVELAPASHVAGGIEVPKGPEHALPSEVTPATVSKLQTRFTFFHPNKAVVNCEKPERGRWGKPPSTYRGLRKIWTAQDTAVKNRTSFKPKELVKTPIPFLGLAGTAAAKAATGDGGTGDGKAKESSCGCDVGRRPAGGVGAGLYLVGLAHLVLRRGRRRTAL